MPLGSMPALGPFGQSFYNALKPLAWDDSNQGYALAHLVAAFSTTMEDVEGLIRDDVVAGTPGWSQAVDINRAPSYLLPWLAQFVGVDLNLSLTDAQQRQAIRDEEGFSRGTLQSLIAAIQRYLTGTKTVLVHERDSDAYHFGVVTYASESGITSWDYLYIWAQKLAYSNVYNDYATYADPFLGSLGVAPKVDAAIKAVKPAGLQYGYQVLDGQDYWQLWQERAQYIDVLTTFSDYQAVMNYRSMGVVYTFELLYLTFLSYQEVWNELQTYQDTYDRFFTY